MTGIESDRRRLLAAGATAASLAVAGCSSVVVDRLVDEGGGHGGDDEENGEDNGGDGDSPSGVPAEVDSYLTDNSANLYEGSVADQTGEDSVTVMVGAGNGLAFDAPAIRVTPGTEVTWEWTGEGGAHNVESTEAPEEFSSGETIDEEGHTWSYTFENEGNYMYQCYPHRAAGMHGAVVVGGSSGGGGGVPAAVDDYLTENDASLYEGSVADQTGEDSVTVMVGAGNGLAFDAPAIRVTPGTEVTWEWTGEGGAHNVESTEAPEEFSSGETIDEEGHTWSYTFESEGNYMYQCYPHRAAGMHGAVIVSESSGGGGDVPSAVDSYLSDNSANLYEGSVADQTGEDAVTVMVGAGNGLAFDPPAVRVDAGTEVTWEWTGEGGAHNVESTEAPEEFSSGETIDEEGHTWSYTFEESGNYMYQCYPHRAAGMHGAVIVE